MDIQNAIQGITLINSAITTIKQVINLLPDDSKKVDATAALNNAERELKLAEAQMAIEMDYELCRKHFPPEIMLEQDPKIWICPICGKRTDKNFYPRHTPNPWNSLGSK